MMQVKTTMCKKAKIAYWTTHYFGTQTLWIISLQLEDQVIDGFVNEKQLFHWVYKFNITQDGSMDVLKF